MRKTTQQTRNEGGSTDVDPMDRENGAEVAPIAGFRIGFDDARLRHNLSPAEAQLLKLPRFRWPSFHRGGKKDGPLELKGSSTNPEASVSHVYTGGNGGPPGPPPGGPPLGPPLQPGLSPSLGPPPPSLYGSPYPFGPFGRPPFGRPPNAFIFPNIMAPPPPPPPHSSSYYSSSSSSGRKTRRRRPVYDNDSLEDASTEDEPVYIKVKPRKRRPIVIDEEELLGRSQGGGSSEEIEDSQPKVSYKSRSKSHVVYVDSSREYQSPNERRMLIKNEDIVQDASSYHSPAVSSLHASGGYQLNGRGPARTADSVLFMNDIESSTGPSYHIDGHREQHGDDFSGHFLLQNMRQIEQHRQMMPAAQQNAKTFRIPESSTTTPTIRIVLNSMNASPDAAQLSRHMNSATTPNPLQFGRTQIPAPLASASQHNTAQSINHFQVYDPTANVFQPSAKGQFRFDIPQQSLDWPHAAPMTLNRDHHRLFGYPRTADIAQPTSHHSQTSTPVVSSIASHDQAASPNHQQVYARPIQHEDAFYIDRPRRKTSFFTTTESTALSTAQVYPNQQLIEFSCLGRRSAYYANRMYKCQIYHQCSKRVLTQTFMCPNGTAFNEKQKMCERADKVACVMDEGRATRPRSSGTALHQISLEVTEQPPQVDLVTGRPPRSGYGNRREHDTSRGDSIHERLRLHAIDHPPGGEVQYLSVLPCLVLDIVDLITATRPDSVLRRITRNKSDHAHQQHLHQTLLTPPRLVPTRRYGDDLTGQRHPSSSLPHLAVLIQMPLLTRDELSYLSTATATAAAHKHPSVGFAVDFFDTFKLISQCQEFAHLYHGWAPA
ncbi:hypothetical protein BIW11_11254 [Tropilaelaps mercedesae]|uniref:Chitin-binding type-2 domain-containing protein n=1 Tax=Tropilaelaps mercedesae TaxID=418985 RepID=A0A1V9XCB0_9ACAR|nr:hypothetical protein BIW11_11254 [Tropilaelaps mercedesae]